MQMEGVDGGGGRGKRKDRRGEDERAAPACSRCGRRPTRGGFSLAAVVPQAWPEASSMAFDSADCAYSELVDRHPGSSLVRDGYRPMIERAAGRPVRYVAPPPPPDPRARTAPAPRSIHLDGDAMSIVT